jgi:hypothetical protein
VRTLVLEKELNQSFLKEIGYQRGLRLDHSLFEGEMIPKVMLNEMQLHRPILVLGAPKSFSLPEKQRDFVPLKYRIVAKQELEDLSRPDAWTVKKIRRKNLEVCSTCHDLAATHHFARKSSTFFGVCDDPRTKSKVCNAYDSEGFLKTTGKTMHEVLSGRKINLTVNMQEALVQYAMDCIGRGSDKCIDNSEK